MLLLAKPCLLDYDTVRLTWTDFVHGSVELDLFLLYTQRRDGAFVKRRCFDRNPSLRDDLQHGKVPLGPTAEQDYWMGPWLFAPY